jgi:SAM-dependent MidA family methyltransferase
LQQGEFLRRLGIETRAAALKSHAPRGGTGEIDAAVDRLIGTGARKMGVLFKVMGIADPALGALPGFNR